MAQENGDFINIQSDTDTTDSTLPSISKGFENPAYNKTPIHKFGGASDNHPVPTQIDEARITQLQI